jgi:hypothetical protein
MSEHSWLLSGQPKTRVVGGSAVALESVSLLPLWHRPFTISFERPAPSAAHQEGIALGKRPRVAAAQGLRRHLS